MTGFDQTGYGRMRRVRILPLTYCIVSYYLGQLEIRLKNDLSDWRVTGRVSCRICILFTAMRCSSNLTSGEPWVRDFV